MQKPTDAELEAADDKLNGFRPDAGWMKTINKMRWFGFLGRRYK